MTSGGRVGVLVGVGVGWEVLPHPESEKPKAKTAISATQSTALTGRGLDGLIRSVSSK